MGNDGPGGDGVGGKSDPRRSGRVRALEGDGSDGGDGDGDRGAVVESGVTGGSGAVGGVGESVGDDVQSSVEVGGRGDGGVGAVYSISGRRGSRVDGPGGPASLERNVGAEVQGAALGQVERFESTSFLASLKTARVGIGGDVELTITVPLSEKYQALKLTDAPGVMLLFHVQRKKRRDGV